MVRVAWIRARKTAFDSKCEHHSLPAHMDVDTERAALIPRDRDPTATKDAPSSSRRRRWAVVGVATSVVVVACVAMVYSTNTQGKLWTTSLGLPIGGVLAMKNKVEVTRRQYRGDLHTLSWHPKSGFSCESVRRGKEDVRPLKVMLAEALAEGNLTAAAAIGMNEKHDARMRTAASLLTRTIERYMPSRLETNSPPFQILFEVHDNPKTPCSVPAFAKTRCDFPRWTPVFAFGSTPKDTTLLPPLVPATLLVLNRCISAALEKKRLNSNEPLCEFLQYPEEKYSAAVDCGKDDLYKAACRYHGLFSIDAVDDRSQYEWDNLIPRAVWRGSDYPFLNEAFSSHKPDAKQFMEKLMHSQDRQAAMRAMVDSPDIGPRLRTVLLSKLHPELIDARFYTWANILDPVVEVGKELGFEATQSMSAKDFGKFKYHLDIGGGGGTTWSGVIPKLSMPGVLLHHETSMKDSYFDSLTPWVHYIPVSEDLHDLIDRIQWAEANPSHARQISDNASAWVREFRKLESLLRHNYQALAVPLAQALGSDALVPFELAHAWTPNARTPTLPSSVA